jgi:thymidine kinase
MFIEPHFGAERRGWIEVICGSMFSGKTEELIRRLKRAKIANLKVEIFKPLIDVRFDDNAVVSHDSNSILSTPVATSREILELTDAADLVGIDEAQFFDQELIDVCEAVALRGARVIVAGLDMDYRGKPFGPVPQLLAIADFITKLHAICAVCGNLASMSFRKTGNGQQVLLGEQDIYEPRCRKCYYEGLFEQQSK